VNDRPRWLYPLLLALPFLAGIAALRGLTVEIDTFHGSDARVYHLPTIHQFADQLPGVHLGRYPAAQTPLYHLTFALAGKVVGFELWRLRLLNVGISYLAVLALFRLLLRFGLERVHAFALALVFALSPYFFGASFTILTDNLAILFGVLAIDRFKRTVDRPALGAFALGCAWMAAAVLTRQSFVWLVPVAAWALVRSGLPSRARAAGAGLVGLALAPLAALVVTWHGLVPPSADPASCGLCTDKPGVGRDAITLRTVGFTLALFGLYGTVLHGPRLLRRLRELWPSWPELAPPLVAAVAVLAVSPLAYKPIVPGRAGDAGYLWKIADHTPVVLSSELLFWVLVPLGTLALFLLLRRAGWLSLQAALVASFLLAALPVRLVYQKYFDPFALLALMLLVRPPDLRRPADYLGAGALCVGFAAYALAVAL
jgi:4-amino-4-deoxy-L-arabinose transferase-like glycosyltransferase